MKELRKLSRVLSEEGYEEYVPTRRRRSGVPEKEMNSFFDRKYRSAMSDIMHVMGVWGIHVHSDDLPVESHKTVPNEILDYIGSHPDEWNHRGNKRYNETTVLRFTLDYKKRHSLDPVYFENGQYGVEIYAQFSLFDLERILVVCSERGTPYYDEAEEMSYPTVYVEMGLEGFDRSPKFIGTLEDMIDDYIG